jgi:hypothetical protein
MQAMLRTPPQLDTANHVALEQARNELKRLCLAGHGRVSDEEIGKLSDLANDSFPQLREIVEKTETIKEG